MMNKNLMMYVMDCKWYGMIVVIETNEEAARNLMKNHENYEENREIKVFEINKELVVYNYGDLWSPFLYLKKILLLNYF